MNEPESKREYEHERRQVRVELKSAREITLKKLKPLAPPFHEHIARGKLRGQLVRVGDKVVVYEIVSTEPTGPVIVTEQTKLRFE